jgi:hypothetical protein
MELVNQGNVGKLLIIAIRVVNGSSGCLYGQKFYFGLECYRYVLLHNLI